MKTFEDYMKEVHAKRGWREGTTYYVFRAWLSDVNAYSMLDYGQKYADEQTADLLKEIKKELNELNKLIAKQ